MVVIESPDHVRVAAVSELPPGTKLTVPIGRFGVVVYNINGEYYALNNYCPHMGAEIGRGPVTGTNQSEAPYQRIFCRDGEVVRCPWHGWEFDIKTGRTLAGPTRRVQTYRAWVEDGVVFVSSRPGCAAAAVEEGK
jgi:nitrite reductase/ring-hydroxylating ferredoxin subunit